MEDTELSWKINKAGMKIRLSANSVIKHDYSLNVPLNKFYLLEKGRIILLRKHFNMLQLPMILNAPYVWLKEMVCPCTSVAW